ncbi:NAD-dependent epimerase/dehydratase family protein [Marinobacter subterrani]|uniref:Nucleoside-diphosphate-sugar epimerase n=1 Tax=Marinobacter subterrani TaxID=1658765 RepID=A0A0J7JAT3_9GAMM|nr:NAD-dependent epimerase/dehydratase family protein [Marinobacter subterrani]KMQ75049.1 Nucleoside-diphosphate-sugar epimerase [Marinobacter subterrani]
MEQSGTVAVTGAKGFVGQYLCEGLRADGYSVRELSRNGGNGADQFAIGDLGADPVWTPCLQGVDTVIHCAALAHAPLKKHPSAVEHLFRVNCHAVDSLAKACRESGVRRLIFLSSVKVYGESTSGRPPFAEGDILQPEDDYGRSKCQAEAILKGYQSDELQICCLRLPLVYGAQAKANFARLRKLALSGLPVPLGGVRNRRSVLALANLLMVVLCLLQKHRWSFFELNVADPEPVSTPDLLRIIAESSSRPTRLLSLPDRWLRALASLVGFRPAMEKLMGDLELSLKLLARQCPDAGLKTTNSAFQYMQDEYCQKNGAPK